MASDNPRRRCAIYTRKSTEEGLDKAFNSLDAQREACAAYVMSQQHEGWTLVPDVYDDGGFSGGTIQRPALQQLLADVRAGRVDVVVVYKIDRLTRSLSDFAKIVDVLDAANASFVSVTQAMVPDPASELRRIYREDLATFAMRAIAEAEPALVLQWNWHHDLIVDRLIALYMGDIRRLLICVPPRSLKSLLCSVVYPAWLLGREEYAIVCADGIEEMHNDPRDMHN